MMARTFDCIVVGGGHAGISAALSAAEAGCKDVLIVEKAPKDWVGGNGFFTAGVHRTTHRGLSDLLPIVKNVKPDQVDRIELNPYSEEDFMDDLMRWGDNRPNPKLARALVQNSWDAVQWLAHTVKIPFILSFNRQAYETPDGKIRFTAGLALSVEGDGEGLIYRELEALRERGVEMWFDTAAIKLISEEGAVTGVVVRKDGKEVALKASAVVLACGGFESSRELRIKHLGPEWGRARVRGTPYNTGDGILMAEAVNAKLSGDWQSCHSTCWDANAPADYGDRKLSNQYTKAGYPLGIMVNLNGDRFVDEGLDFRNYTFAKFGKAVLHQPESFAFQVWDAQVLPWLRAEEYADNVAEKFTADTIEELADKLATRGLKNKECFLSTVRAFNDAVHQNRQENPNSKWDPTIKDGLSTRSSSKSVTPEKTNWALPIEKGPFLAVKVTCGISYTFGGLTIDPETAGVLSENGEIIRGLFCTGEMIGDLYYNTPPGGTTLTAGVVFGMKAGRTAAKLAGRGRREAQKAGL